MIFEPIESIIIEIEYEDKDGFRMEATGFIHGRSLDILEEEFARFTKKEILERYLEDIAPKKEKIFKKIKKILMKYGKKDDSVIVTIRETTKACNLLKGSKRWIKKSKKVKTCEYDGKSFSAKTEGQTIDASQALLEIRAYLDECGRELERCLKTIHKMVDLAGGR